MSASEKLKALEPSPNDNEWGDGTHALWDALPQIVAVVEAAEKMRADYQDDMDTWMYTEYDGNKDPRAPHFDAALAALDEALS